MMETPAERKIKILLVDDEVNITKAIRRLLMDKDQYEIFTAESGPGGLALLRDNLDFGIIISDQRMPEMTGVEFLSQARELSPDAFRILLTGHADVEASIAAINKGAVYRYLTKPWNDDDLVKVVDEAAHGFWLVAENKRLNALVAKQNAELKDWNDRLKRRVLDQTAQIREKNASLAESNFALRTTFAETIAAFAELSEMFDRRYRGHCRNVADLVTATALILEVSKPEREKFHSAALLHDIGKIGMSEKLLLKSMKSFDPKDTKEYQKHVVRGQAVIDKVPTLREIGVLIRHHHERFDGRGFPDKLTGNAIPLGARMIGAADMFDRLVTQYPEADALESSIAELGKHWGKALDPALQLALEKGAREVYKHLNNSAGNFEKKVPPKELKVGMQLCHDLFSGTGVLLLNKGSVFDEASIEAVKHYFSIDPFEREIAVLISRDEGKS